MKYKPPHQAKINARKVLRWREKYGENVEGMTRVGWTRANQLASGKPISADIVKRMAQFARHEQNYLNAQADSPTEPWREAAIVAWLGWGGTAGIEWAKQESAKMQREKNPKIMHKSARDFALKYKFRLGRWGDGNGSKTGLYYLQDDAGEIGEISNKPTAQSAIAMMRKQLRFKSKGVKYRAGFKGTEMRKKNPDWRNNPASGKLIVAALVNDKLFYFAKSGKHLTTVRNDAKVFASNKAARSAAQKVANSTGKRAIIALSQSTGPEIRKAINFPDKKRTRGKK